MSIVFLIMSIIMMFVTIDSGHDEDKMTIRLIGMIACIIATAGFYYN